MTIDTQPKSALRYWRKQKGLSQTALGEQLNPPVSRIVVWTWEKNSSQPTREQMEQISEILGKPITMLFDIYP